MIKTSDRAQQVNLSAGVGTARVGIAQALEAAIREEREACALVAERSHDLETARRIRARGDV